MCPNCDRDVEIIVPSGALGIWCNIGPKWNKNKFMDYMH
jgi:hypothetical protein